MSVFLIGALVLLVLAAVLLWPRDRAPRAADADDPNLGWYRQRRDELADQDPALMEEARLRLLEDGTGGTNAATDTPDVRSTRWPGLLLVAVVIISVPLIYQQTGSLEDVLIHDALGQLTPEDSEEARDALVARIEARSRDREDNLQYLGLLGRLYMAAEDYAGARDSFGRLAVLAPEDPQALALAAQARFLAAGRVLDQQAQLFAEQALALDPQQRTALGLLGMASFEAGAYSAAVTYWGRLQAMETPDSPGYRMLEDVLTLARERAGIPAPEVAGSAPAAVDGPRIAVDLRLAEGLSADPQATVYVFARRAGTGGMPVAVRRLSAGQLPMSFELRDADAMAGQKLSEAGPVTVTAQLSRNGQPGAANARFLGQSDPVEASASAAVSIELRETSAES